ncbi:unnamed protein product [Gadus morhua 'NCC']
MEREFTTITAAPSVPLGQTASQSLFHQTHSAKKPSISSSAAQQPCSPVLSSHYARRLRRAPHCGERLVFLAYGKQQ